MGKRVLLFIPTLEMGGAERQALGFAAYLKKKDIDVALAGIGKAYGSSGNVIKEACTEMGIPCFDVSDQVFGRVRRLHCRILLYHKMKAGCSPLLGNCLLGLLELLRRNAYDTIVSYCAVPGTVTGMARYLDKNTPRFLWYQRDAGIQNCENRLQEKAIKAADVVLANSVSGQKWLAETYQINAKVVYNGVERKKAEYSSEQWYEKLGIDASYQIVTMVANLSSAKDHMTLLRAWKYVVRKCGSKKLLLVLAGRWDDQYAKLSDWVVQNSLSESVRFLGAVSDVFGLYEISSVCAFSTFSEGNPNALIEAAMTGLAVAATDLPEIREVLCRENQEYLFEQGNVKECAEKIAALLNDKEHCSRIGAANREKAAKAFDVKERFDELLDYM
ncbi:MAG: glycosyltransferase family 4 protein [Lachnospiraceae bacterium]|nr:glycosyltransferase family 4 protein [Lachnospiraceae bacterium]